MSTPDPIKLLDRLPEWLRALRNPLTYFAVVDALAVVLFYLAVNSGALPVELRTFLAVIVLVLFGAPVIFVFLLAWNPGDRWASPEERAMSIGPQYGTDVKALPRAAVRQLPAEKAPPSGEVLEAEAKPPQLDERVPTNGNSADREKDE